MGRFTPAGFQRRGRATRLAVPAGADVTAEVKAVEPVRPMFWAWLWSLAGFRLWWLGCSGS
jgi:hypothetical protein